MAKMRLDVLMTQLGLAESRQKAQAIIMSGQVYVNDQKQTKAGAPVTEEDQIEVRGKALAYVSRGGLKLEKAMKRWPITLNEAVCADIGASTGGFTDCMLQNGAQKVYAVDVGYNQLDYRLRTDPRVVCMERTNARYLTPEIIEQPLDFASVDVSFISLNLILPALRTLMKPEGQVVCLVKPQFEAGRAALGKNGIVTSAAYRFLAAKRVITSALENGFDCIGFIRSPIEGGDGNKEYLAYFIKKSCVEPKIDDKYLKRITSL